jgi:hypothetical protein
VTDAGVIHGGWGYVWAAYVLSALVLFGYALLVHVTYRAERARAAREAAEAGAGS